jgi:7,8-dihydropterin-6-yl-methyl-4-(beta-D-ribofuranosyl)aminobenzene 5'-phosphate synthase
MASQSLLELDSLTIQVIVDNELDPISPSPNPQVTQSGGIFTIGMTGPDISHQAHRGGAGVELRMDNICCGAHGLSLLITGRRGDETHTVLFDTGPEEQVFERNATRLGLKDKVGEVEDIVLSHWHRDHSGGMLKAIAMVQAAKKNGGKAVRADLHPARPTYRGVQPPNLPVVSMEADPTFAEIEGVGGKVVKSDQPHLIGGDMFMVSGEILRETEYERGLRFGVRFDADAEGNGKWEVDEKMADERFLMCNIKGMCSPFILTDSSPDVYVSNLSFRIQAKA